MKDVPENELGTPWYEVTVSAKLKVGESIPSVIDIMTAMSQIGFALFDSVEVRVMKPKSLYYNKLPHEAIHDPCFIPDENDSDDYLVESKEYSVYDPEIYDAGAQGV